MQRGQATIDHLGLVALVALLLLGATLSGLPQHAASASLRHAGLHGHNPPWASYDQGLLGQADALLDLPAAQLVAIADGPAPPEPFDWSTDGCSPPTPPRWARRFRDACRLHDFGYRNLGHGLALDPTEGARKRIDDRFLSELLRTCQNPPLGWVLTGSCRAAAHAMHLAVRRFGARAFYAR